MEGEGVSMHPDDKEMILCTEVKSRATGTITVWTWRTDSDGFFVEIIGPCGRDGFTDPVAFPEDDPAPGATIRAHHNAWVMAVADDDLLVEPCWGQTVIFRDITGDNFRVGGNRWFQPRPATE